MAAKNKSSPVPKQVVYLWGAGATHAEVQYLGAHNINLLMRDSDEWGEGVATRILGQLPKRWQSSFAVDHATDIEKLISLLAACNVDSYTKLAETIRQLYFEDIRRNLSVAKVLDNPALAIGLLALHADPQFQHQEVLTGIVTTNHDGLLQVAAQHVHSGVNLGIPFRSDQVAAKESAAPPLVHLHGSFTWTFALPIQVTLLSGSSQYSRDTVWIPPTIVKESKSYPFNKLAGLAYELLSRHCDVLRVVGSALTQNDWHVLSMLFNAQRHRELTKGAPFRIELVMPQTSGLEIAAACSYLKNLTPIGFLTDGDFAAYKDDPVTITPEMKNPFFYWLKEKIEFHQNRSEVTAPLAPPIARISGEIP
jgi:hypothetical protein